MLIKLLKKDLKATYRFFIPLLCGYAIAALLGKFLFEVILAYGKFSFEDAIFNGLTIFTVFYFTIFLIYLIACYIMSLVFIIFDFYKTMVSDHGYLTHTLPVKTSQLIWSKTLVGVFWQVIVNLLVGLSTFLLVIGHFSDIPFRSFLIEFIKTINLNFITYSSFTLINMLIEWFSRPLMIFACISSGQLWKTHRILGSILAYIGIYMASQIINTFALIITNGADIYLKYNNFGYSGYMVYTAIFGIATTIIFFLITNYILSNHLNLE